MPKKEKTKTNCNIELENIIENTFNHIKDIVDANTVVGNIIKLSDNNFVIPVSKISVGIVSGGGTIPKQNGENVNAGSGTGFNIVPIGFVAYDSKSFKFLSVNDCGSPSKKLLDIAFKIYENYFDKDKDKDKKENNNEK